MPNRVDSIYCGYCPQISSMRTIKIRFAEMSFIGKPSTEYKKILFDCSDAEVCQHLDEYGRCPLFIKAPNHP